jgi:hypothetical protein
MDDGLIYSLKDDPWKLITYNKHVQKAPPSKRAQLSIFLIFFLTFLVI